MATIPDFLGSPLSRDQRNNPFHEQAPETKEDGKKTEHQRKRINR